MQSNQIKCFFRTLSEGNRYLIKYERMNKVNAVNNYHKTSFEQFGEMR